MANPRRLVPEPISQVDQRPDVAGDQASRTVAIDRLWPDPSRLGALRRRLESRDAAVVDQAARLRTQAESLLALPAPAVVDKQPTTHSPTSDPHDYVSIASYFHPDPAKVDGLPYISRDGELSCDFARYDRPRWDAAAAAIILAARAAVVFGEQRFAADARRRLRRWFLDPSTRMTPHLRFAQFVPGGASGRPYGIIDFALYLPDVLVAERQLAALADSPWTVDDARALTGWCEQFLAWLETSELGRLEEAQGNNHGTCFDRLAVALALHLGDRDRAVSRLREVPRRIARQIEPDGSMPGELRRTCSFGYSALNTRAFVELAAAGRLLGVDLWEWRGDGGRGIPAAVSFIHRHACSREPWPYPEREPIDWMKQAVMMLVANDVAGAEAFPLSPMAHRLPPGFDAEAYMLVEPIHPFGQQRSPSRG
jgi:hypothetical protein